MKLKSKWGITSEFPSQFKRLFLTAILPILGLGLVGWIAFFWNLGNTGLVDETEPLFAEAARQMLVTGDWITPYFNEVPRFDKPPLIYWLMAIAYRLVGVNEWGVRLPSALAALFLLFCIYYILQFYLKNSKNKPKFYRSLFKFKIKLYPLPFMGAALIAFNPETIAWARIGVSDMLLNACMGSALLAFFRGYAEPNERKSDQLSPWYFAFYIFLALAVLTKGPIGFVLPVLIIGSFTLYLGNIQKVLQEICPILGSFILLIIVLPWYIFITAKHGLTYLNDFFGYHNFQRFTQVVNNHDAPWYFYFIIVLIGFAPWSVYLPVAIVQTQFWQRKNWQNRPRLEHLPLFSLFWFGCIFIFFSISVTKLPSYVLPLMPASALLVALFWNNIYNKKQKLNVVFKPLLYFSLKLNLFFLIALSGAIFWSYHWLGDDPDLPDFREALHASGLLELSALIWMITAVIILFLLWKRQPDQILTVNLIGFIAFLIFAATPANQLLDIHRQEPLRQLAETVTKERISQEYLLMIGFKKPSLVFYTQNPVKYFQYASDAVNYLRTPSVQKASPDTVLILADPQDLFETGLGSSQYQALHQAGVYQLIRVPKLALLNLDSNPLPRGLIQQRLFLNFGLSIASFRGHSTANPKLIIKSDKSFGL
ncbi:glycosyltransferase family 39 protein [Limnoraphis robusta Tam1]|uniref:ArnT family glycosyltransferase n=1 Tax=Limnoraphis robusta TaxID=1118279 RepID=UPI002B218F80|nr:glycosyltransferase family 39 protein [Limnoraphis robusta]MEA5497776.1 glycosyltransferase family 39 protein [Limnoraphis robusta BA-68 BA1]MEA5540838.1 glycosyltransferase family 39 protein [Limnoraphis robusta Tam1]